MRCPTSFVVLLFCCCLPARAEDKPQVLQPDQLKVGQVGTLPRQTEDCWIEVVGSSEEDTALVSAERKAKTIVDPKTGKRTVLPGYSQLLSLKGVKIKDVPGLKIELTGTYKVIQISELPKKPHTLVVLEKQ